MSFMQQPKQRLTLFFKFLSYLPVSGVRLLGKMIGNLALLNPNLSVLKTIRLNLDIALKELSAVQRQHIYRASVRNESIAYLEFMQIWANKNEKNLKLVDHVFGQDLFEHACQHPHGLILVVPHFGTWEIMNAWISQFTDMTIMYKPIKNIEVDQFVRIARARERATLVSTDDYGVRAIFKTLKQGGVTAILPDHSPRVGHDMCPWFGVPVYSSPLIPKLLQKTKARGLLLYALRNNDAGYDIHIEALDEKIDQDQGLHALHQQLEQLIHRYPEHYHWSFKRFSANPKIENLYDITPQEALEKIQNIRQSDHD